jgi:hypothetical protein
VDYLRCNTQAVQNRDKTIKQWRDNIQAAAPSFKMGATIHNRPPPYHLKIGKKLPFLSN